MTKSEEILQIAQRLRELWPDVLKIEVEVMEGHVGVSFYRCPSYEDGTTLLRDFGVGRREKHVVSDSNPWCYLTGATDNGIFATAYCQGLPPACRVEEYVERVPKADTIVRDDEFIEVKRKRVVCEEGAPE